VDGDGTRENDQGQASIAKRVTDQRNDDKSTIDRADQKDVKERGLSADWDMKNKEENEQKVAHMEEDKLKKEKIREKSKNKSEEDMETSEEEGSKISEDVEEMKDEDIKRTRTRVATMRMRRGK
jgi:hypothetical protein